jgi:hypothetical protein
MLSGITRFGQAVDGLHTTGQECPCFQRIPQSLPHLHRPNRAALNKLRFDHRLAGVFFSLADIPDPAHDAVRHRAAAPADMRDRWLALAEIRVVVDADQGKILRHPDAPVHQKTLRCEIGGSGAGYDRGGWGALERRVKVSIQSFQPTLPTRHIVGARSDTASRQCIEKGSANNSRLRYLIKAVQQHNPLVTKVD